MSRLAREDWLMEGLKALSEGGVDALKVERLCVGMGVTKGSFYHHFANRQAYLEAILEFWESQYTTDFISFSEEGGDPQESLRRLVGLVLEGYGTREVGLRGWAKNDPLARGFIERVDRRRLAYLFELTSAIREDEEGAWTMAQLFYTTLLGSADLVPPVSKEELSRIFEELGRWLIISGQKESR